MSGSRTIIGDEDRLDNVHPGEILHKEFLIGSEIPLHEVAEGAGLSERRLRAIIDGVEAVDAEVDLRLGRYFGMSEGFFLGLQNDFDLEEARRSRAGDLDRIIPRAA